MTDWSHLSPEGFELLSERLLRLGSFTDIKWYGHSGGEKGRDLTAISISTPLPGFTERSKWVVQCRRNLSRPVSKAELSSFLTDAREHKPDCVLLITTLCLTPDTKDWLESVRGDYNFRIFVWEPPDLEEQLRVHRGKLSDDFQILFANGEPSYWAPVVRTEFSFGCGDFDEIEIRIHNKSDQAEAIEELSRFLEHVRANQFKIIEF